MRTITLEPGEEIIIKVKQATVQPIADEVGRRVLPVLYLSQNSPTAKRSPGDCGPAVIAMAVAHLTDQTPTVDQVAQACGQMPGSRWTNFAQLTRGAHAYGLTATWTNPITEETIEEQIDAGKPVIALINYSKDPNRQDKNYREAHFWLVVGYSPSHIIFHDPDRLHGDFGEFREITKERFLHALRTTHELPSNDHSNHGMVFDV